METIYAHTQALCSICQAKVNARVVEIAEQIFLQKHCPRHGVTQALVCSDAAWYRASRDFVKPGQLPVATHVDTFDGCPESCGLCPAHQQHTCLPVIEITTACDMDCPICLKELGRPYHMTRAEFDHVLDQLFRSEDRVHVVNLSGGEPTLHPHLEHFLRRTRDRGVMQTSVSTNGNRFLHDRKLRALFRESGTIASLQFDGFSSGAYEVLRGEDLARQKLEIIDLLEEEGIAYSLVATINQDVNEDQITDIVDFFFESAALSLMFQPATFTGHARPLSSPVQRTTIPDVVRQIEKSRYVSPGDFNPLPCAHYSCFALAYYFHITGDRFLSMKEFLGLDDFLSVISNRTLPGLDHAGYAVIRDKVYDFWSAADSSASSEQVLTRIRAILREMNATAFSPRQAFTLGTTAMKSIFIHQFMDAHTMDFGRLMKCCNHYARADGRLLPMCAANVFFQ